jgi:hypothetical protein
MTKFMGNLLFWVVLVGGFFLCVGQIINYWWWAGAVVLTGAITATLQDQEREKQERLTQDMADALVRQRGVLPHHPNGAPPLQPQQVHDR